MAAGYEGGGSVPVHEEDAPMAAVVRARVTAAKCVNQAVAVARAELAQLAADADAAERKAAAPACNEAAEVASPMESTSETEADRGIAIKTMDGQPGVSSADEDAPEPPDSGGEGSEVHTVALPCSLLVSASIISQTIFPTLKWTAE